MCNIRHQRGTFFFRNLSHDLKLYKQTQSRPNWQCCWRGDGFYVLLLHRLCER